MQGYGERIKAARKNKKLSQKELGEILGVTGVTIMRYEKEQREPTLLQFKTLSKVLGVELLAPMTTGQKIKLARLKAGVTQKELSEHCKGCGSLIKDEITEDKIQKFESDEQLPEIITLGAIATRLGTTAPELIGFGDLYQFIADAEGGKFEDEIPETAVFIAGDRSLSREFNLQHFANQPEDEEVKQFERFEDIYLNELNEKGRKIALERMEELAKIPDYTQELDAD